MYENTAIMLRKFVFSGFNDLGWSFEMRHEITLRDKKNLFSHSLFYAILWLVYFLYSQIHLSCVCVLITQSCPTLCDPVDCSPPGSIHGILQIRILEWVAISFSKGSSWPRNQTHYLLHWQVGSLPPAQPGKPTSIIKA